MPLYDYECPCGGRVEALRPAGTASIEHACGQTARRVFSPFAVIGAPTGAEVRSMYRRFQEATQEMDHAQRKAEADLERPIPSPNLWGHAKESARQMIAAGEAPPLAPLG